jgi:hypothetical protein
MRGCRPQVHACPEDLAASPEPGLQAGSGADFLFQVVTGVGSVPSRLSWSRTPSRLSRLTLPLHLHRPSGRVSGQTPLLISGCPDDIVIGALDLPSCPALRGRGHRPENLALRHQLAVLRRSIRRPRLQRLGSNPGGWGWLSSGLAGEPASSSSNRPPSSPGTATASGCSVPFAHSRGHSTAPPKEVERRLGGMRTAIEPRCNVAPARVAQM